MIKSITKGEINDNGRYPITIIEEIVNGENVITSETHYTLSNQDIQNEITRRQIEADKLQREIELFQQLC